MGSTAFRTGESWMPLCLPKFNSSGAFNNTHMLTCPSSWPCHRLSRVVAISVYILPAKIIDSTFISAGFLYAHVSFIDDACRACLLLLSTNKDAFFELSDCRTRIIQVCALVRACSFSFSLVLFIYLLYLNNFFEERECFEESVCLK